MPRGPSRPLTTQEVFAALTEAAVDGVLDNADGGVAPETLASASRLDCSTAAVRRPLIDLLAAGYVEGHHGRCPETGFPRQSFLPNTVLRSASDVH